MMGQGEEGRGEVLVVQGSDSVYRFWVGDAVGVEYFSCEGEELGRDGEFVALFERGEEEGDL